MLPRRRRIVKFVTGLLVAGAVTMAGCEAPPKPAPQATTPSVLDVNVPPPRPAYQTPVYTTPAYASAGVPNSYAGPVYLPPAAAPAYVPPAIDPTPTYTQTPGQTT